tara:strand:- start:468 stop:659 length:192 start_codon:yes stop_codon:yes gene_type:complete
MNKDYKLGYADGVSDLRNKLMMQVHDVLEQEKSHLESKSMDEMEWANLSGWIECLEMMKDSLK